MSIDKFFDRTYHPVDYNCAHFVCEVWDEVTGRPVSHLLRSLLLPKSERSLPLSVRHHFVKLKEPVSPCLAIFDSSRLAPHCGIFRDGRILHITMAGVQFQPPRVLLMTVLQRVEYYDVR